MDQNKRLFRVGNNANGTYRFGFTGLSWAEVEPEDEFSQFSKWAREVRREAGIDDPEPEPKYVPVTTSRYAPGQILWSGKITVPGPRFHTQLHGIISGSTEDKDK